ncbi:hypothetical protein BQ8794_10192 [Mesorhizobium prunaredense]|uniref:Uncharacterized protein n=2 Tax=Mesorhizobium prunaredense TaxID=1631249 RepID=A0A1R3UYW0_9HYPH|nr:hypothetical protein BQ8794_10192 [Mesorhizobium prunaredense]
MPRYSNQTLAKNALRDIRNSIEWLNDSLECIEERNIIELSPDDYTDLMEGGLRVLNNLSDFPKATGDDGCFQERWIEVKEKTAKPSNGHR